MEVVIYLLRRDRPLRRRLEKAAPGGALILVDRTLIERRRQRHAHRQISKARRQAVFADQKLLVELGDALLEAEQRPGIGGAVLIEQEAALCAGEIGRRAVHRADVVDRDRPGATEAGQ